MKIKDLNNYKPHELQRRFFESNKPYVFGGRRSGRTYWLSKYIKEQYPKTTIVCRKRDLDYIISRGFQPSQILTTDELPKQEWTWE